MTWYTIFFFSNCLAVLQKNTVSFYILYFLSLENWHLCFAVGEVLGLRATGSCRWKGGVFHGQFDHSQRDVMWSEMSECKEILWLWLCWNCPLASCLARPLTICKCPFAISGDDLPSEARRILSRPVRRTSLGDSGRDFRRIKCWYYWYYWRQAGWKHNMEHTEHSLDLFSLFLIIIRTCDVFSLS